MSYPNPPQPVQLNWTMPDGSTGALIFDAALNEQHVTTAQVTEHQVETGTNVADHIRPMPKRISIEGMVTNTPIVIRDGTQNNGVTISQNIRQTGQSPIGGKTYEWTGQAFQNGTLNRVFNAFQDLQAACLGGALFSVFTTISSYSNMVAVSFAVPRNVENGNSIQFTIDFQEIRTVTTQEVEALASRVPKKSKVTDRGSKPPKEESATSKPREEASAALQLLKGAGAL